MNRMDYMAGLLIALLLHACLGATLVGLWPHDETRTHPRFSQGDSSLAMTFVIPPHATGAPAEREKIISASDPPIITGPELKVEENVPTAIAVPPPPANTPVCQPDPNPMEEEEAVVSDENEAIGETSTGIDRTPHRFCVAPNPSSDNQGHDATEPQSDAGDLSKGIQGLPRMVSDVHPVYPSGARHRGEQGHVMVHVEVSADGRVKQAEVLQSSGYRELDQTALNAIWHARFMPARRNDTPVASNALITFRFQLNE